jgi:hypothetical protein
MLSRTFLVLILIGFASGACGSVRSHTSHSSATVEDVDATATPSSNVYRFKQVGELLNQARAAVSAENWTKAAELARRILKISPDHREAIEIAARAVRAQEPIEVYPPALVN